MAFCQLSDSLEIVSIPLNSQLQPEENSWPSALAKGLTLTSSPLAKAKNYLKVELQKNHNWPSALALASANGLILSLFPLAEAEVEGQLFFSLAEAKAKAEGQLFSSG